MSEACKSRVHSGIKCEQRCCAEVPAEGEAGPAPKVEAAAFPQEDAAKKAEEAAEKAKAETSEKVLPTRQYLEGSLR